MKPVWMAAWLALGCSEAVKGPELERATAGTGLRLDFDGEAPGVLPDGWTVAATRPEGPLATWMLVADPSAPSAPNALALTAPNHDSVRAFNLCWTDGVRFQDGALEVAVRAVAGEDDQGGGPMWRVRDADNYYVCRANPLESNFRLYSVRHGERKQLASAKLAISSGTWHQIRVEHEGDKIACWLDGAKLLEATDAHLAEAGGIGLWTKADAVTSFDDLRVEPR